MSKIELTDSMMDILGKMAEGNPGAIMAMMGIIKEHDAIDPQAALGALGALLMLDDMGIYGWHIAVLFSDTAGKSVRKFLLLMRAVQLGIFSHSKFKAMSEDSSRQNTLSPEEWADIDAKVCEELAEFARPETKAKP